METTAYTSDNIITRSYEEYHQVILNYITYRIAHRYEAEDLTQDVFVRLMDYKQMLRPDTVKYFLFTIARYTLNRFEDKSSPEIASELELSCRTVENHLFLGRRDMRDFFRNCI